MPAAVASTAVARAGAPGQVGLEAGRLAQRDREHRAHAVDHVRAEQQRDAQARLLQRDALGLAPLRRADAVEQRADAPCADAFAHLRGVQRVGLRVHVRGERPQRVGKDSQLAHFLFDRHLRDEGFNPFGIRHPVSP
ncbi:hypothetical protein QE386_002786 [Pseudoxanthomonas winnipegensis]|nr:hypothetical protein [Pseudoxanthomonas winnipegensis]